MPFNCSRNESVSMKKKDISAQLQLKPPYSFAKYYSGFKYSFLGTVRQYKFLASGNYMHYE
jgi:hypothetical protein